MKYGKLTLVRDMGRDRSKHRIALWRCDCGTEKTIETSRVVNGYTRSCGCMNQVAWRRNIGAQRKENEARTAARKASAK